MLNFLPAKRATAQECLKHPWLDLDYVPPSKKEQNGGSFSLIEEKFSEDTAEVD